jgi:excisionase family DNA binding protein
VLIEPPMLTVPEIAVRFRVSRGAVYALIRGDVLPAIRVGRSWRVAEKVVANFIESGGAGWPGGWRKRGGGEAGCPGRTVS